MNKAVKSGLWFLEVVVAPLSILKFDISLSFKFLSLIQGSVERDGVALTFWYCGSRRSGTADVFVRCDADVFDPLTLRRDAFTNVSSQIPDY